MIGTSLPELAFIRTCIFLLEYSPVLCALGLAGTAAGIASSHDAWSWSRFWSLPPTWFFATLLALELLYIAFLYLPYKARLEREAQHPPPLTPHERRLLFKKCLANVPDPERYLHLWFLGADASEIRRDNVREFLLWGFFDRHADAPTATATEQAQAETEIDMEEEVQSYIAAIEQMLGRPLQPGRGTAKCLRLTLDRVETRYRSVVWYVIVAAVDLVTHCALAQHGFQYHAQPPLRKRVSVFPPRPQALLAKSFSPADKLDYWYRPHTSATTVPVVFLHGIGIGLWPYTRFLAEISETDQSRHGMAPESASGQTGVIAIEFLPVSFRMASDPLDRDVFLSQAMQIVEHHGWDRFVLASHSYGSVLTTHMIRSPHLAPKIKSVVLIDPVSILLHLPDVAYNFTRRWPRKANEWQLWYFASMDPGVALCLGRHFFWRQNAIWKEELEAIGAIEQSREGHESGRTAKKRAVAVCLGGRDLIVDTVTVAKYLLAGTQEASVEIGQTPLAELLGGRGSPAAAAAPTSTPSQLDNNHSAQSRIEVLWFPRLDHAQVFYVKEDRQRVLEVIRRYCAS